MYGVDVVRLDGRQGACCTRRPGVLCSDCGTCGGCGESRAGRRRPRPLRHESRGRLTRQEVDEATRPTAAPPPFDVAEYQRALQRRGTPCYDNPDYALAMLTSRDASQAVQEMRRVAATSGRGVESKQPADDALVPGKARICQHCAAHNETGTGAGTCKFALDERAIKPRLERDESGKETCNFFDAKNAGVSSHAVYNG